MDLWPLDLYYQERDACTAIIIYGKDRDGNVHRIEDESLFPYFLSTEKVQIPGAGIEWKVPKKIGGRPVEMARYTFAHPRDVRTFRHLVSPESLYEADMYYSERYTYDRRLSISGWNDWKHVDGEVSIPYQSFRSHRTDTGADAPSNAPDIAPPPLTMMSLDFEMYNKNHLEGWTNQLDARQDKILMAGICTGGMFADNDMGEPPEAEMEPEVLRIDECGGEAEMLEALDKRIKEIDPDIIFTYSGNRFDIPYADARSLALGRGASLLCWGRDGSRIRPAQYDTWHIAGRCHIDLHDLVKQTLAQIHSAAIKPLSLKNVCREYLKIPNPIEMDKTRICSLWDSGQAGRDEIERYNASDASITLKLGMNLLPFAIALSNLTCLPLDHLFAKGRGHQVDHFLMKLAIEENEAIPMKPHGEHHQKFSGAHVVHPVPGVHQNVSVIDFTSMYPNILMNLFPNYFLARASRTLFEMKKVAPKDTPQARAIKSVLLSVWGYLGWDNARWKDFDKAAMITRTGRDWIKKAIEMTEGFGMKVIYGDTDSIFIKKPATDRFIPPVPFIAEQISKKIGCDARLDKRYQKLFFTETKEGDPRMKAYVGVDDRGKLDVRGLDMIRGDISLLGQISQELPARLVLYHDDVEAAKRFEHHMINKVRRDAFPMGYYIIRKGMNKNDRDYKVVPAHLMVARRLKMPEGAQVEFVISDGEGRLAQRARHPTELMKNGKYLTDRLDKGYYIRHQIIPPAMRILKMFGVREDDLLTGLRQVSLDDGQ